MASFLSTPPNQPWPRTLCAAGFVVMGIRSAVLVIRQSKETAAREAKLTSSLEGITQSTLEVACMTQLNTDLQERLLKSNETIASLSTGGDSFCWLAFSRDGSQALIMAVQHGAYPLRNVSARMVDLQKFKQLVAARPITFDNIGEADTYFDVGDLSAGSAKTLSRYTFGNEDKQDFNIFFNAMNGFWTQALRLRRVNGRWHQALKVMRLEMTESKWIDKPLFEQVDPEYPRTNGVVDWGE